MVKKDAKPIFLNAVFMIIANFIFNILFMKIFGVAGVALSTTVTYALSVIVFAVSFYKRF
jgi:hypothetical protein